MPLYPFEHPETKERQDVFFHMNDEKIFIDGDGVKWDRIWEPFNFAVDSKINPWSQNDFIEKTGQKKGTMGDLWDKSEELSKQRAKENGGVDPIRKKYFKEYSKKRKGVKHPTEIAEKIKNRK